MVGYVDRNNKTVLWDVPEKPPGFINVTSTLGAETPGKYVFGQTRFPTKNIHITSLLHRKIAGQAEEFLLGTVTVLIIALLSEMVFSVLMRTRRRADGRSSKPGIHIAFLVDEYFHLRNIWRHIFGPKRIDDPYEQNRRKWVFTSLLVLTIASTLMAADVFAVYLTQPKNILSSNYQYNLRGLQPILTERGATDWVRRMTRERTCVTPVFTESQQRREYSLSSCIEYDIKEAHNTPDAETDVITVRSFYHKAGSDHEILFGEAYLRMRKRAYMYMRAGGSRRMLFDTHETEDYDYAKYIHDMYIHSVMQFNCNKNNKYRNKTCQQLVDELETNHKIVEGEVRYWRPRGGNDFLGNETGIETTYRVAMNNAFVSVTFGINPLTATAVIQEVEGPGLYINATNENEVDNVDSLLLEEGRVAGLFALLFILLGFVIIVIVLRICLVPDSLGSLAWGAEHSHLLLSVSDISPKTSSPSHSRKSSGFSEYEENLSNSFELNTDKLGATV